MYVAASKDLAQHRLHDDARIVPKVRSRELGDSGQLGLAAHSRVQVEAHGQLEIVRDPREPSLNVEGAERADHLGLQLVRRHVVALAQEVQDGVQAHFGARAERGRVVTHRRGQVGEA